MATTSLLTGLACMLYSKTMLMHGVEDDIVMGKAVILR